MRGHLGALFRGVVPLLAGVLGLTEPLDGAAKLGSGFAES